MHFNLSRPPALAVSPSSAMIELIPHRHDRHLESAGSPIPCNLYLQSIGSRWDTAHASMQAIHETRADFINLVHGCAIVRGTIAEGKSMRADLAMRKFYRAKSFAVEKFGSHPHQIVGPAGCAMLLDGMDQGQEGVSVPTSQNAQNCL